MIARPRLITSIPPDVFKTSHAIQHASTVITSFQRSGFDVVSLGRPGESSGSALFPTIEFLEGSAACAITGRYGPSFGDLLGAMEEGSVGGIVNSDVYLAKSNIIEVLNKSPGSVFVARRLDVERLGGAVIGIYERGIDGMFFSRNTVSEIRDDSGLASFQIGAPFWDVILPIAASFHHDLKFLPAPLLSHPIHDAKWNDEDYRFLRSRAVKAIVNHAEKYRHQSRNADSFLSGLARHLDSTRPNSVLRREKRTAEFMGHWLGHYQANVADLEIDLTDPFMRASAQRLFSQSAEGLLLANLLDAKDVSLRVVARLAFRAFRRSFKARRKAHKIEKTLQF